MFEYFPDNYVWNMAVVTLVDEVGTISEPDTALRQALTASGTPGAQAAWFKAMSELGAKLESYADADAALGHLLSAARKYHRAAMYFIRAERMVSHTDPLRLPTYERALKNYRQARVLGKDPIEFVRIPYKGAFISGLFLRGEGEGRRPTVIHLQGFDSLKETQYPYLGGYRTRKMSALIVDQPGAGEALRLHGLTGEVETENYVKVLVDYLETRSDVDASRIGLAGLSMGGYFAPRAASFEPRIKACAAWGACYDVGELMRRRTANAKAAAPAPEFPSVPDVIGHALWTFGLSKPEEWVALAERLTLKGVIGNLKCPLLVTHGENDRQIPLEQARATIAEAGSIDKTLKIFTIAEGGAEHCQLDNRYLGSDFVTDWFSDKFSDGGALTA
jgi:dienelactone hydrolase